MTSKDFVHLHVHTEYSLLDGACRIDDLCKKAASCGMRSLAMTDHGVMYGAVEFYEACKNYDIKPIIGCEVYTAPRSRFDRDPVLDSGYGHLILLAETDEGYHNLIKIVSASFIDGFYYKPRVDRELLKKYSGGLIALSACLKGEIPQFILSGDYDGAKKCAVELSELFGRDNFYLELQSNGLSEQIAVNNGLIRISRETGIPLVATNDVHYLEPDDHMIQDVLMCIQTGKKLADENRMKFTTNTVYFRTQEEMNELFRNVPEAIENTALIADRCNVSISFGRPVLPVFELPDGLAPEEYLRRLAYEGAAFRYGKDPDKAVIDRIEYELGIISRMGYCEYYLIVWDFIKYAKDNGILVGPGRGSGAGSIIAYCLKITNIDPLKFNLAFERFLNPERVSMPDFDVDFSDEHRKDVIDYVIRKYGAERVAQIVTFGTMASRAAVRDVGRVMDVPYAKVDSIAKLIPMSQGNEKHTLIEAVESNPELKKIYSGDGQIRLLIDTASKLEGMPRNCSTHAAGVVLTEKPVTDYVPLHKSGDIVATQYPMSILEKIGLLKIDFLGLRTLSVIQDALELIRNDHGVNVDFDKMSLDDKGVFELIGSGQTSGIFQLESKGMTKFMTELKPDSLEDIIAGIALYRPGPMNQIPVYIRNKKDPAGIVYETEELKPILDITYGCIVYQEQVMQIFRDLAGYTMGASDIVRRAMAKKKHDVMAKERDKFIDGAKKRGVNESAAIGIFDMMADFASYAFNKAHAACYAVVAYETAYLKRYYPAEFMAGIMNSLVDSPERVAVYINECRQLKLQIMPPDVNEGSSKFTVSGGKIIYALGAIKNVGLRSVEQLVKVRSEGGRFVSFYDFCYRTASTDINKRTVESLIKAGAFDSFGHTRRSLLFSYEDIMDSISASVKSHAHGQLTLFDDQADEKIDSGAVRNLSEFESTELLNMEKSVLGLYLTGHPLKPYFQSISRISTLNSVELHSAGESDPSHRSIDGTDVTMAGIITSISRKTTKTGSVMAFLTVEDLYGSFEVVLFPKTYEKYGRLIAQDMIAVFVGRVNVREDETPNIYCASVAPLDSYKTQNDLGYNHQNDCRFYIPKAKIKAVKSFCDFLLRGGPSNIKLTRAFFYVRETDGTGVDSPAFSADIPLDMPVRNALEYISSNI